jgi:death-on-curing protein
VSEGRIRFLSLRNVLRIHEDTIAQEGGTHEIRDEGLLASAVDMPQSSFAGEYLHRDLAEMAAAYLYHICQNHPFLDGNKRTAAFSSLLFLAVNGISDDDLPSQADWEEITLTVAAGTKSKSDVAEYLRSKGITRLP